MHQGMLDYDGNSWDTESGLGRGSSRVSGGRNTDDSGALSTQTATTYNTLDQVSSSPNPSGPFTRSSSEHQINELHERARSDSKVKKKKKAVSSSQQTHASPMSVHYRGIHIYQAAEQGSLPLCVLLWGMASAKRVNLFLPDAFGNNALHHAALADSPEVIGFLLQQSKALPADEVKLVEIKNALGETALSRCMARGIIPVAKALIENGSDLLTTDLQGNSVFTKLAKSGQLWCLNFMYHTICTTYGSQVALELMCTLDNEGHSALDWAADAGNVNVIEFFVRKGLNPYHLDPLNRSPLYWAVKANRVAAARFLVQCGCNPLQVDSTNQTPMALAKSSGNRRLIEALSPPDIQYGKISEQNPSSIQWSDPLRSPPLSNKIQKSHAIYQHNLINRFMSLIFAICFFALWLLTVFMPWYAWLLVVALGYYIYKRFEKKYEQDAPKMFISADDLLLRDEEDLVKRILMSSEKGIGLWIGTMTVYVVYLLSCFYYDFDGFQENGSSSYHLLRYVNIKNIFHIGGIGGARNTVWILWLAMFWTFMSIVTWLKVVWWNRDPGIINTRAEDFEEVLAQSLQSNGAPPASAYCRTTMVKKPLRSKYCAKTGAVVARMDHYCIWLNATIGYGNHRSFMCLLISHFFTTVIGCALTIRGLFDDTHRLTSCGVAGALLNREYFFVTVLCAFFFMTTLGLGALVIDQLVNITTNMTTNERLNSGRYSWISMEDGVIRNRLDRGTWNNILEFCQYPGYKVDYMKSFEPPAALSHENMHTRIRSTTKLLMSYSGQQVPSGPPSIDLEVARNRADSGESFDTTNNNGLELM